MADPVGNTVQLTALDAKVDELIVKWSEVHPIPEGWFGRFRGKVKTSYTKITRFLIDCLDELIVIVEDLIDLGPDKKATVLCAINKIYDAIVAKSLPIWLVPFSPMIKRFVINIAISAAIDFIVLKYTLGTWKPNTTNTVVS